jgi:hypothetical protein
MLYKTNNNPICFLNLLGTLLSLEDYSASFKIVELIFYTHHAVLEIHVQKLQSPQGKDPEKSYLP